MANESKITSFDRRIRELARVRIFRQTGARSIDFEIGFQFPPVVMNDNKGGDWEEIYQGQAEPFAYFKGGNPREIQLKWSYVVGFGGWDINKVAHNVRLIRSYFYNSVMRNYIIEFGAYNVVGPGPNDTVSRWTFRSDNVTVQHGDTIIADSDNNAYPLRTDISMNMKLLTNINLLDTNLSQALINEHGSQVFNDATDGNVLKSLSDLLKYGDGEGQTSGGWF